MSDKDIMQELEDATHVTPDLLRRMVMAGSGRSSGGHTKANTDRMNALEERLAACEDRQCQAVLSSDFSPALDRIKTLEDRVTALEANVITPAPDPDSDDGEKPHKRRSHH